MELDLFDTFTSAPATSSSSSTLLPDVQVSLKKRPLEVKEEGVDHEVENKTRRFVEPSTVNDPSIPKVKRPPAKVYKFKLDTFQQEAVNYIDNDESVLVAAHTSAGKTAVAEYAIAKSLRDKQRVIYTSPIKALSNQKFRDLQEEFGDVGLMTGDMTINPNASCLIMTTEILRSMLYRGSEVVREVAWVIYDEVHYMRDKERGVVWEESIILLPHKVRFVFLSATIPNAPSFVDWVSKIHHQPCHVVYTDYRPVPLQHYVFPAGAEGLYLVVDEKSKFREENFQKAMACLQPANGITGEGTGTNDKKSRKEMTKNQNNDLIKIIRLIMERQLDPCIVFSFSKKECEAYAMLMSKLDFNNDEEKVLVTQVYNNAMEALSEDDQQLPQIQTMLPLLKRGIGIHHGGLLPILKEVIEILFQEGLIKCLFATETFSIGINMPAKTVVFTATRKYDGKDFRWISSGEYIQMSGRAGRRGKDDKGIVIQMLDEKMEPDIAKNMIYGASDPLYSSYHLGYNMVLNMMRVEDADPIHIIKSSFHQYQQELNAPKLIKQAEELEREVLSMNASQAILQEDLVGEYLQLQALYHQLQKELNNLIMKPLHILPFLQSGRMLQIQYQEMMFGWGCILQLKKNEVKSGAGNNKKLPYQPSRYIGRLGARQSIPEEYYLEVLLEVRMKSTGDNVDSKQELKFSNSQQTELEFLPATNAHIGNPTASSSSSAGETQLLVVYVGLDAIAQLSAVRLNVPSNVNQKESSRLAVKKAMNEVVRRFANQSSSFDHTMKDKYSGIPLLHPISDLGIHNDQLENLLERKAELEDRVFQDVKYVSIRNNATNIQAYQAKRLLIEEANKLRQEAQSLQSVTMREELKKMRKVLKKLEYITVEGVLTSKGRFACEVSAGDELMLTNIVFSGLFNQLNVSQTVALLSCFVHQEHSLNKDTDMTMAINKLRTDMQKPYRQLQSMAREIAKICIEMKIFTEEEEYVNSFDPAMIDVTYAWVSGVKFVDICKMTDIFEGSIIRSLRRLEELLRQLAAASLAIGNQELVQLFTEGAAKIRRGVVFAASLYI